MTEMLTCLLLPLQEKALILPSSAIAEIISFERPKLIPDIPKWLVGISTWRGIQIPLTHLEDMESHLVLSESPQHEAEVQDLKHHVAVINRVNKIQNEAQVPTGDKYPFFSIVLKSVPKLYHLTQESIKLVSQFPENENSRYLMEVKVKNDYAFVPNLPSLWKMIDALPSRLQWFRQIII